MKSFLRVGLMLFLSAEYFFCAFEKYVSTSGRIIKRRMIGGKVAENGEFPFLVAIFESGNFQGAFTLITSQTLVGAAHIVESSELKDYCGRIGNVNKNTGKEVLFGRRIIHPRYDPETNHDDIALLILALPIKNILPIALVGKNLRFTKGPATFVGWGKTDFNEDDDTDILRVAKVQLVDPKYVARKFDVKLTYKEIITMSSTVKAMKGDSGSPLMLTDVLKRKMLIGILANGGKNTKEPDFYMSTSVYYDFIKTYSVGHPTYLEV
ncbi:venom peptide isomerase heavy chain-like [Centruroides vittatus]|uniref:venom peptide isomerase heavy chain-like n=1 Tax=Centruroides vittatus TaxID=120091 RepID=UPI00350E9B4C